VSAGGDSPPESPPAVLVSQVLAVFSRERRVGFYADDFPFATNNSIRISGQLID
jgi:hypothetical protein